MINEALLKILVCPETKQPVKPADDAMLNRINRSIQAGTVKTRNGSLVTDKLDEGLVREDGKFLYAIRNNIPIMLIDEAIPL